VPAPSGGNGWTVGIDNGSLAATYTKQKPDGTASGNVAAKWNVAQGAAAFSEPANSGAGSGSNGGFTMVKLMDAATPKLFEAACKGTHLKEVTTGLQAGAATYTYTKQKPDGTASGNVAAKWNVAQGAAAFAVTGSSGDTQGYIDKGFDVLKLKPW